MTLAYCVGVLAATDLTKAVAFTAGLPVLVLLLACSGPGLNGPRQRQSVWCVVGLFVLAGAVRSTARSHDVTNGCIAAQMGGPVSVSGRLLGGVKGAGSACAWTAHRVTVRSSSWSGRQAAFRQDVSSTWEASGANDRGVGPAVGGADRHTAGRA